MGIYGRNRKLNPYPGPRNLVQPVTRAEIQAATERFLAKGGVVQKHHYDQSPGLFQVRAYNNPGKNNGIPSGFHSIENDFQITDMED